MGAYRRVVVDRRFKLLILIFKTTCIKVSMSLVLI
jgi:hypothetical protein